MKFAVPITYPEGMDSEINDHFGMAEFFAIFDMEGDKVSNFEIVQNTPSSESHEPRIQFLKGKGVEAVIVGGIGQHMVMTLEKAGIGVYKGAVDTVANAIGDYNADMLTKISTTTKL